MRNLANKGRLYLMKEHPISDLTESEIARLIMRSEEKHRSSSMRVPGSAEEINELIINAYSAGFTVGIGIK